MTHFVITISDLFFPSLINNLFQSLTLLLFSIPFINSPFSSTSPAPYFHTLHPPVLFNPTHDQFTLSCSTFTAVTIVTFSKTSQPLMSFLAECARTYTHTLRSVLSASTGGGVCVWRCWMDVWVKVCEVSSE